MKAVRVLIADDHHVMRQGVRSLVETMEGWAVCGETSTGREAVEMVEKLQPQIVVLDIQMPDLNGLEATRQIRKLAPETEVLILTGLVSEGMVRQVFEAGARSCILKTDGAEYVMMGLRALAAHKPYFTPRVQDILLAKFLTGKKESDGEELTEREREIVQLLAEGKSNKEIAAILGVSPKTAETHRFNIMRKLKLQSLAALIRYAIRHDIIAA